jgi:hypothetical protein
VNFNDPRGLAACEVANGEYDEDCGGGGFGGVMRSNGGGNDEPDMPNPDQGPTSNPGGGGTPAIKIPSNAPYTTAQLNALQMGFGTMWLKVANYDCARALQGSLSGTSGLRELLSNTEYRILKLATGEAAKLTDTLIVIDPDRAFFNRLADANNIVTFYLSDNDGPGDGMRMSLADFRGFLLLHELGHQTGVFPPDLDKSVNKRNSLSVINNCFKKGTDGLYR